MENINMKNELTESRTSCAFRWFFDRSENLPILVYRDLDNVKNSLSFYLNSTKTHFRRNLSKSEKLEAMQILKDYFNCEALKFPY
jgi:hypothetical protein